MNQGTVMDKSQQNDLAAMLGVAHVEPEVKEGDTDAQTSEELETDTGQGEVQDAGGEESQGSESEGEEAGEGEAAEEEASAEDTPITMRALMEVLQPIVDKINESKTQEKPKEDQPEALPEMDFIGDEDIDDVTTDKAKFNKLLHKASDHGYNKAIEQMLRILPGIVTKVAAVEVQNQAAAMEFYRANDDLIPHKASVAKIYNELLGKNPSKDPYELLKDLAPEARKRLKLKPKGGGANTQQKPEFKKPGFAPGSATGKRGGAPVKENPVKSDLGKMLNLR